MRKKASGVNEEEGRGLNEGESEYKSESRQRLYVVFVVAVIIEHNGTTRHFTSAWTPESINCFTCHYATT